MLRVCLQFLQESLIRKANCKQPNKVFITMLFITSKNQSLLFMKQAVWVFLFPCSLVCLFVCLKGETQFLMKREASEVLHVEEQLIKEMQKGPLKCINSKDY